MEEQCSPLSRSFYYQQEDFVEELKHFLLYSTLELEAAVVSTHEEIARKDDEVTQLRDLLAKVIEERDEFRAKCERLMLEKRSLVQQHVHTWIHSLQRLEYPVSSYTTSIQKDVDTDDSNNNNNNNGFKNTPPRPIQPTTIHTRHATQNTVDEISIKKTLPEWGKFLQAVMDVGPLLQTLLLAGPLPQWQHPPPQLSSGDIPLVKILTKTVHNDPNCMLTHLTIDGALTDNKKRVMINNTEGKEYSSPNPKHHKIYSPTKLMSS